MQINDIKRKLINLYINSRGWRTNRKLVVIESDDWGSIRMPSQGVYDKFLSIGFPVDRLSYLKFDALESNRDLETLFQVLTSVKDNQGNHPVITANTIMTNPDFEKIRQADFKEYHYELFSETLKRYPAHDRVLELYSEGIANHIFYPQLHGREHLNVKRWMLALQNEKSNARLAFDYHFYDLGTDHTNITEDSYVDALSLNDVNEFQDQEKSISESVKMFEDLFGYPSVSFIAPCYIWHPAIEKHLYKNGLKMMQGGAYQLVPEIGKVNIFHKKMHYTGQKSKREVLYSIRNCYFEPSTRNNLENEIPTCMRQIQNAFKNRKPAVITSHRVNYIGFINNQNSVKSLEMLKILLVSIVKKWPDVEFISSDQLYELIR